MSAKEDMELKMKRTVTCDAFIHVIGEENMSLSTQRETFINLTKYQYSQQMVRRYRSVNEPVVGVNDLYF